MKWLTPEERSKIESWLDSGFTSYGKHTKFYRLFVAIALESGLRSKEILTLVHGQFNAIKYEWEQVLRLKRKSFRSNAPMGRHTFMIYKEMFPDKEEPNQKVFYNGPTYDSCYKFCLRLGERLQITRLTPHRFRHSLGKDMADFGAKPSEIQKILGQSTPSMSVVYSEASDEDAMKAAKRVR